jgi:hypothetical protein
MRTPPSPSQSQTHCAVAEEAVTRALSDSARGASLETILFIYLWMRQIRILLHAADGATKNEYASL